MATLINEACRSCGQAVQRQDGTQLARSLSLHGLSQSQRENFHAGLGSMLPRLSHMVTSNVRDRNFASVCL
jgi:hypothetical protein